MDVKKQKKKVSVVIPCRNEKDYIGKCIESIINQSYGIENIEILVADGCSQDGTPGIVSEYSQEYSQVRLIRNERKVAPAAMNLGIKSSEGSIIIIFGAHAYMDRDYVAKCVNKLEEMDIECVGGRIINISENEAAEAISLAMASPFGVGNALFRYSDKEELVDTVAFGAYNRSIFDKIGYFDEEFVRNQDDELNFRIIKSKGRILLSPDILSYYYTRGSFRKLWTQYYQYGFWKVRVIQKHKRPASLRHLVPMAFVLNLILGGVLSIFFKVFRYLLALLLILYTGCAGVFALKATKGSRKHVFRVMLAFIILHVSYGLGFLEGIYVFYITGNSDRTKKNTRLSR